MKELLSPAGNMECLKAAIKNGADAVYLGGKSFGARKYANNFTNEELKEAVDYAHLYGVKVYVTVNIIVYQDEVEELINYVKYLYNIGVDALIMQDIGMISLIRKIFPNLEVNASTQMHNHNDYDLYLLKELGIKKAVLDREMSFEEISKLNCDIEKEVFIHGALCNSYSGCCLFSSMNGGRSGNRGECVQSCRLPYRLIKNDKYINTENKYLLSTKELCTIDNFDKLKNSNINSFKIEGRMKSPSYVGYVTRLYRKLLDGKKITSEEIDNLKILFNREFTPGYLFNNNIMNINSSNHQGLEIGEVISVNKDKIKIILSNNLYQEDGIRFKKNNKGMIANFIYNNNNLLVDSASSGDIIYLDNKIDLRNKDILLKTSSNHLDNEILNTNDKKIPININVCTSDNEIVISFDDCSNKVSKNISYDISINRPTTKDDIKSKLIKLGNTPFIVNNINIDIPDNIFISMKIINDIRRSLVDELIKERIRIKRDYIVNDNIFNYKEENKNNFEIAVTARTKEQVEASIKMGVDRIYVSNELYDEYKDNANVYLRLPRVISNYENINSNNVLVTELGGIYKYKNCNVKVVSDYFLNVVNNYSIKFMLDHNVKRVTLSPEINYNNLDNLIKDKIEIIIYGRIELMLTKSCPIRELNKCPCNNKDKYYLEDIYGNKYPIIHGDCLTHIMHYKNIDYFDKLDYYKNIGIKSYRLELFDEDYDTTTILINKLK